MKHRHTYNLTKQLNEKTKSKFYLFFYLTSKLYYPNKSGKKMTGCYSPWRLVANKFGVVSHHTR